MTSSSAPDLTKRRLAFEPAPKTQQSKNAGAVSSIYGQLGTRAPVELPPEKTKRPAVPVKSRPSGSRHDRHPCSAKARLSKAKRQVRTTSATPSERALRFQSPVQTGAEAQTAGQTSSQQSKFVTQRPKRMTRNSLDAGTVQLSDAHAAGAQKDTESLDDENASTQTDGDAEPKASPPSEGLAKPSRWKHVKTEPSRGIVIHP